MPKRPKTELPLDTPEYLLKWARELVAALGKKEARRLLADFKTLSANSRLPKRDREIANARALALNRCCELQSRAKIAHETKPKKAKG